MTIEQRIEQLRGDHQETLVRFAIIFLTTAYIHRRLYQQASEHAESFTRREIDFIFILHTALHPHSLNQLD